VQLLGGVEELVIDRRSVQARECLADVALSEQAPPTNLQRPVRLGGGLFVCGDHRDSATLDGALKSGRRAAKAILADVAAAPEPVKQEASAQI
jgi:hypothetical protein